MILRFNEDTWERFQPGLWWIIDSNGRDTFRMLNNAGINYGKPSPAELFFPTEDDEHMAIMHFGERLEWN